MNHPYDIRPACLKVSDMQITQLSDIPDTGKAYTKQRGLDALIDRCELSMSSIAPTAEISALTWPLHVVNSDE